MNKTNIAIGIVVAIGMILVMLFGVAQFGAGCVDGFHGIAC